MAESIVSQWNEFVREEKSDDEDYDEVATVDEIDFSDDDFEFYCNVDLFDFQDLMEFVDELERYGVHYGKDLIHEDYREEFLKDKEPLEDIENKFPYVRIDWEDTVDEYFNGLNTEYGCATYEGANYYFEL